MLVDDMIDTAGTLTKAAELIMEKEQICYGFCTHAILIGTSIRKNRRISILNELIVTDTINLKQKSIKLKCFL